MAIEFMKLEIYRLADKLSLLSPPHQYSSVHSSSSASSEERAACLEELDLDAISDPEVVEPTSIRCYLLAPKPFSFLQPTSFVLLVGLGVTIIIYTVWSFPATTPLFIGGAVSLTGWTILSLFRLAFDNSSCAYSTRHKVLLGLASAVLIYWAYLGVIPPKEDVPMLPKGEKYFIAANLYDNEGVFDWWSGELLKLAEALGINNTYISIYESNSKDQTKRLLSQFNQTLFKHNIPHRLLSEDDPPFTSTGPSSRPARWWPYGTAPERIAYLSAARNLAMAPIQSSDPAVRVPDWEDFTKVIFLNDVYFSHEGVMRLINTRMTDGDGEGKADYDLACAMDYGWSGLYDTWASRDICGIPLRAFWPYVKDSPTITKIRKEEPFEVAACWNGMVVFPAGPYLWSIPQLEEGGGGSETDFAGGWALGKRGWKMIDDPSYPNSRLSPALSPPLKFRPSGIDACDHSECFLFSYDLHRLYNASSSPLDNSTQVPRRPRIYMNPTVKVAYDKCWYRWHNTVLRIGVVKWWNEHWSRGFPLKLVDWIFEAAGRRRDYCTWAGLRLPDRCPPLPGPKDRFWDQ